MPDTLREKVAEIVRSVRCADAPRVFVKYAVDAILALVEADARERERKAFMECHRWRGAWVTSDVQVREEIARRYKP